MIRIFVLLKWSDINLSFCFVSFCCVVFGNECHGFYPLVWWTKSFPGCFGSMLIYNIYIEWKIDLDILWCCDFCAYAFWVVSQQCGLFIPVSFICFFGLSDYVTEVVWYNLYQFFIKSPLMATAVLTKLGLVHEWGNVKDG